jgi:hypothetical protein
MAQTKEKIDEKLQELFKEKAMFNKFLDDIYGSDEPVRKSLQTHLWRVQREIDILKWVVNDELPF